MLRWPFRYRRSYMYAAVSDISYIAESVTSWRVAEGKRLGGESVGLQYLVSSLCMTVLATHSFTQLYIQRNSNMASAGRSHES